MGYRVSRDQFIRLKNIEKEFGTLAALDVYRDGFQYKNWEVLRKSANNNDFETACMRWEFIPPFVQDEADLKQKRREGIPWLNAKAENLLTSKMWRDAALKRRCIVPISHFFEWRHFTPPGQPKPVKYPHLVSLKNKDYFFAAGIWQTWTDKTAQTSIDTFALVTTAANELMAQIHNDKRRMPTILDDDLAFEWIMGDLPEWRILEIASQQLPPAEMTYHTIRKDFKKAENPLEAFTYDELPALLEPWNS